jgi:hypothetical protein
VLHCNENNCTYIKQKGSITRHLSTAGYHAMDKPNLQDLHQ